MLEKSNSNLEALKARTLELETSINRKENLISEQKRLLKATKEEAASNQEVLIIGVLYFCLINRRLSFPGAREQVPFANERQPEVRGRDSAFV
jgi:uncharacterized membrane protein